MANILDGLMGALPEYDSRLDPLARPLPEEIKEAPVHASQCAFRYGTLKRDVWEMRKEMRGLRVFLVQLIILSAIGAKALEFVPALIKGLS